MLNDLRLAIDCTRSLRGTQVQLFLTTFWLTIGSILTDYWQHIDWLSIATPRGIWFQAGMNQVDLAWPIRVSPSCNLFDLSPQSVWIYLKLQKAGHYDVNKQISKQTNKQYWTVNTHSASGQLIFESRTTSNQCHRHLAALRSASAFDHFEKTFTCRAPQNLDWKGSVNLRAGESCFVGFTLLSELIYRFPGVDNSCSTCMMRLQLDQSNVQIGLVAQRGGTCSAALVLPRIIVRNDLRNTWSESHTPYHARNCQPQPCHSARHNVTTVEYDNKCSWCVIIYS